MLYLMLGINENKDMVAKNNTIDNSVVNDGSFINKIEIIIFKRLKNLPNFRFWKYHTIMFIYFHLISGISRFNLLLFIQINISSCLLFKER